MFFVVKENYQGNIVFTENFIRNDMKFLDDVKLRCYMYISMLCQTKADSDIDVIADKLGVKIEDVVDSLNFLEERNYIKVAKNKLTLLGVAKTEKSNICSVHYSPEDLNSVNEDEFRSITESAQQAYGKLLDESMVNSLLNIYKWVALPPEVINLLMFYLASKGKKSMSYLEKTAVDWKEKEIDSVDKANEYIRLTEEKDSKCEHIKILLGIYGRNLVKKEKEYILKWIEKFSEEEILNAYEKAVSSTGKISFAYTDKILNSDGVQTPVKHVKTNKFNNFNQKTDSFENIRKNSLNKILGIKTAKEKK